MRAVNHIFWLLYSEIRGLLVQDGENCISLIWCNNWFNCY